MYARRPAAPKATLPNRRRRSSVALASIRRGSVEGDARSTAGSGSPIRGPGRRGSNIWIEDGGQDSEFFPPDPENVSKLSAEERWERVVQKLCQNNWNGLSKRIKQVLPEDVTQIFNKAEEDGTKFTLSEKMKYFSEFNKMSGSCFRASENYDALTSAEIEVLILHKLKEALSEAVLRESIKKIQKNLGSSDNGLNFEAFVSLLCEIRKQKSILDSAEKENKLQKLNPLVNLFPIDPEGSGKQSWDLFSMMLLLYCSFSIPFNVAFMTDGDAPQGLQVFDILVDALFMFDIVLSFLTWYDDKGYVVRDQKKIVMHYLRTWFVPDFAGSFPFDRVIALSLENQSGINSTNFVRILKIFRMLKLIRAIKFMSKLSKLRQKEGFEPFGNMIGVASAMFTIFFVAHIVGCCFTMLLDVGDEDNWLHHYNPELVEADVWVRYQTALYWAIVTITTMGYGDVLPVTTTERIFVIFVAIIGAIVFSYCMGTISSLISQYSNADEIFGSRLRAVAEYLQYRNLSGDLKRRVRSFYSLSYRRSGELYDEDNIMDELNEPLRTELLREIGERAANDLPILQGLDPRLVGLVYCRLRPASIACGQPVYEFGDMGREMYFIVSGGVRLYPGGVRLRAEDTKPAAELLPGASVRRMRAHAEAHWAWRARELGPGDTFGELAVFSDKEEWGGTCVRAETVEATEWTTVLTLSLEGMTALEQECPQVTDRFRELCKLRSLEVRVRQRCPLPDRSEEVQQLPAAATEKPTGPYQLQLRVSRLRMELLRLRESELLGPAAAAEQASEIMQLLLRRGQVAESCPKHPDSRLDAESEPQESQEWVSVSCVLGGLGELLCIEHSLDGLAQPKAVSLGHLVLGQSRIRSLEPTELDIMGRVGSRAMWGFEVQTFATAAGAIPSPTSTAISTPKAALMRSSAPAAAICGNVIYLASTSRQEFDELREALSRWRPQFGGVDTDETNAVPVHPPSDSMQASAAATENGGCGLHDPTALASEIATLQRQVEEMSSENRVLRRKLIYAELRVWDPQDCGKLLDYASNKTVPRSLVEEARAIATVVEAEAERLRAKMQNALGLLEGIQVGL